MSRGANSSPTVLEPLMTTLSRAAGAGPFAGVGGVSLFSEQEVRMAASKNGVTDRPKLTFSKIKYLVQKVFFMANLLVRWGYDSPEVLPEERNRSSRNE